MNAQRITFNTGELSGTTSGINKHALLQSTSEFIVQAYAQVFERIEGSLTTVADNDTTSKFKVAMATLEPNRTQIDILQKIEDSFKSVESVIDPVRLQFTITEAQDNEICINRHSMNGVSTIIINDDGITAYSFIAYKNVPRNNVLEFFEDRNQLDCEHLAFKFFSL